MSTEYYDPEITSKSREELNKFVNRLNDTMGYYPTVIGGWAVYYYTEDNMSQDIDIVIYGEETYYKHIVPDYFEKFGFTERNLGSTSARYHKDIVLNDGRKETIHFDVMLGDIVNEIKGLKIKKDWKLILENQKEVKFDGGKMYVPIPEALITFKIIAAQERKYDMRYESDDEQISWYQGKIRKDYLDIAGLTKISGLNKEKLEELYSATNVGKDIDKFLQDYKKRDYADILERTQLTFNQISTTIKV